MITAVDTSVLLDVLGGAPPYGPSSEALLCRCGMEGALVACEIVWAEVRGWFATTTQMDEAMDELGVAFSPIDARAASAAGELWRRYRWEGGPRVRLVPDFLVGAHARSHADRLLTRDRGFFARYYAGLVLLEPTLAPGA